ncbi:MAG: hypothetical protein AABX47_09325 [Nanoarchaeota archaeon]
MANGYRRDLVVIGGIVGLLVGLFVIPKLSLVVFGPAFYLMFIIMGSLIGLALSETMGR